MMKHSPQICLAPRSGGTVAAGSRFFATIVLATIGALAAGAGVAHAAPLTGTGQPRVISGHSIVVMKRTSDAAAEERTDLGPRVAQPAVVLTARRPDRLSDNGVLKANEFLESQNHVYRLYMQADGNLVEYDVRTGRAIWNTRTAGSSATYAAMQVDGNLVLYSAGGQPIWWSGTNGYPHALLVLQNDGNLVIYDAGWYPIWWTGVA